MENLMIALVTLVLLALLAALCMGIAVLWKRTFGAGARPEERSGDRAGPPLSPFQPGSPGSPFPPGSPNSPGPPPIPESLDGQGLSSAAGPPSHEGAGLLSAAGRPGPEALGDMAAPGSPPSAGLPQGPSRTRAPWRRTAGQNPLSKGWGLRLVTVAVLTLLMSIPMILIDGLVDERSRRMIAVTSSLSYEWGPRQTLTGPILAVPLTMVTEATERVAVGADSWRDVRVEREKIRWIALTPKTLEVKAAIMPETRRRGIYAASVYTAATTINGSFRAPEAADIQRLPGLTGRLKAIGWDQARVVVGLSESRALRDVGRLSLGGAEVDFEPGASELPGLPAGFSAAVDLSGKEGELDFSFNLGFGGSSAVMVAPVADLSVVKLSSTWPHPSFTGSSLPVTREVGPEGFTAEWRVPSLVRSYQSLRLLPETAEAANEYDRRPETVYEGFQVGVSLMDPVDGYHRNERAVKYAMMFIMLNLLIFLLWERSLGQGAIHPVQYVVIGLALALFYLVLLTLSEHLGFGWAYLAASVLDVIMVGGYSLAVTRKPRGAAVVGGLLALLHGVLYVILSLEDYALLAGTTLLIVAMTAVMISTRRLADPAAPSPGPPAGGPVEGPGESSPDNPSPESLSIESQSQESRPSEAASPGEGSEPAV